MLKATYDANDNGIVDNAEKLGGKSASEFAAASTVTALSTRIDTLETDIETALAAI